MRAGLRRALAGTVFGANGTHRHGVREHGSHNRCPPDTGTGSQGGLRVSMAGSDG